MAFFLGGITRTASSKLKSRGTASGSLRTALSISLSVRASTAAQSVLPRWGDPRDTTIKFLPFISSRAAGRDEPADRATERAGNRDFPPLNKAEDLVPDFAMTIRPAGEGIAVKKPLKVFEVDPVVPQVAFALFRIPSEFANAREQGLEIAFSHRGYYPTTTDACIYERIVVRSRLVTCAPWRSAL